MFEKSHNLTIFLQVYNCVHVAKFALNGVKANSKFWVPFTGENGSPEKFGIFGYWFSQKSLICAFGDIFVVYVTGER